MAGAQGGCVMGAPVLIAGCALLVSAGGRFGFMPLHGAGAGMCARRRTFFSCVAKKRRQKKATPLSASLRFASGNLRCSRPAGSRSNSLRCASLRQSRALIRWPLRSSAHTEGMGEPNSRSGHCFARPFVVGASSSNKAQRMPGRAQRRPEWLFGCSPPAGCACDGAVAGWHARRSARAS